MTGFPSPPIIFQGFNNAGLPNALGFLYTYAGGTSTPIATFTDATLGTTNPNPLRLSATGQAPVWLTPGLTYKFIETDVFGNQCGFADQVPGGISLANLIVILTQGVLGSILYPVLTAEGATVVNAWYPYGVVDRYGTNTTPGVTDMGPALQAAINLALATLGSGQFGIPVRFIYGAYSIATKPTFGASTINIIPIDIGGVGIGTQVINNLAASTSPLFDMTAKNGWWLHDFLMCGNSTHKNMGIAVNFTGSAEAVEWRISRITSLMAGVGFQVANTNTGVIEGVRHWPGNNPALIVPQTVTNSDISHGIYLTGSFVNNLTIYDACCQPNSNYNTAMRGIKCDAANSFGVNIVSPLVQTLSGNNNEFGIDYNCSSSASGLTISAPYFEGTIISLNGVSQSSITGGVDGGVGGAIVITNASRENVITGTNLGIIDITDSSCFGNNFIGCLARGAVAWSASVAYIVGNYVSSGGVNYKCILANTNNTPPNATFWVVIFAFNDGAEGNNQSAQPNRFIGGSLQNFGTGVADQGYKWRKLLAQAATVNPDAYSASTNVIRMLTNAAMTINTPAHPRNGQEVEFTIRNESGGAMGVITWNSYSQAGWVNPGNGFNRSVCFQYDSDFVQWRTKWVGTVDIPN